MQALKFFLENKAYNMRVSSLKMTTAAQSGHATSALSAADLVAGLFFYAMKYDPQDPLNPHRDRFVLSKGHAVPVVYAAWKEVGVLSDDDLMTYRQFDSVLEGHPTPRFAYNEAATGSLGMGLSIGAGMAMSAKMDKSDYSTYVIMGDSEVAEGSVWEAAEIAAYYKLNNLIAILDCNRLGQSTATMHEHHVQRYADKFKAFGWHTIVIDGHDMLEIIGALDKAREIENQPTIIIAKTFKGYGVDMAQDKEGFHGKAFTQSELKAILPAMEKRFAQAAQFDASTINWQPKPVPHVEQETCQGTECCQPVDFKPSTYKMGESVATRKAYGQALVQSGVHYPSVVSLDAEVKNSTYAELFAQKFPDRFIQCFIAEQNMVGMGIGLNSCGYIPFISTFGVFFSRAHDQIRMAAIGDANLRLCGSHAGISIGEDGPSQMALEDIAMMRSIPNSVVLYPSDAVSTYKLVEQMTYYDWGTSYLRTTRMATPVIYDNNEEFYIGGCKVLRESVADKVCIIAAGVTLFEALKAYDILLAEGIQISVIDLYSIKPIDTETVLATAQKSGNKVITVEDHYLEGGLGQAVVYELRNHDIKVECLAVTELPRSGNPEQLMDWAGIDAAAIIRKVKELLG